MDGNVITAKRTAAVSAIATKVSVVPGWAGRMGRVLQACVSKGEVGDLSWSYYEHS